MSLKQKSRKLLLIFVMALALLSGAPLRPEEIENLLHQMSKPKVVHVLRDESASEDAPEEPSPHGST